MKKIKTYIANYEYKILYKRFFYTSLIMLVYIFGTKILLLPVTFNSLGHINRSSLFDSTLGADYTSLNIFTLGLGPWLTAMLLVMIFSYGNENKKIKTTRREKHFRVKLLTLIFAVIQSFYLINHYFSYDYTTNHKRYLIILILVTGSMILVWLADQNSQKGIGGPMPIVLMSIIKSMFENHFFTINGSDYTLILIITLMTVLFLMLMILELTEYRIDYVDIMNISHQYNKTYLSWKFNPAGSISIMVSMALFSVSNSIINLILINFFHMENNKLNFLTFDHHIGVLIFIILQLFLTYILSRIILNTNQKTKDFRRSGNYFPNINPGEETKKYLNKRGIFVCLCGSVVITTIIGIPLIMGLILPKFTQEINLTIKLIISVYISLNLVENIKAYLYFDKYQSFTRKYW